MVPTRGSRNKKVQNGRIKKETQNSVRQIKPPKNKCSCPVLFLRAGPLSSAEGDDACTGASVSAATGPRCGA